MRLVFIFLCVMVVMMVVVWWWMGRKSFESGCSWRCWRGGVRFVSICVICLWWYKRMKMLCFVWSVFCVMWRNRSFVEG